MNVISVDDAPKAIGPYSQAVDSGTFVFLSGQIALDPETGALSGGDIRGETARVLDNIEAVLRGAHLSRKNIIKTTVYLTDLADFMSMNEVYADFFKEMRPARSTVQVAALPKGAKIEIDAVACR